MFRHIVSGVSLLQLAASAYVWPSKYDSLDNLLFMQSGYIRNGELSDRKPFTEICRAETDRRQRYKLANLAPDRRAYKSQRNGFVLHFTTQ